MTSAQPANATRPGFGQWVALEHKMTPFKAALASDITELCVNSPGGYWTESRRGWEYFRDESLSYTYLRELATLIGTASGQGIDEARPLLSCTLPTGERVQVVIPPATSSGHVILTVRKPNPTRFSIDDYANAGFFDDARIGGLQLLPHELELKQILAEREFKEFFRRAVGYRMTMLVSGGTGSGKTTFLKSLVDLVPREERLITIEDAAEMDIKHQPNHVRLFYTKGGQGVAKVTARDLMEACLRMKPDRILPAEIRDAAAFQFVQAAQSGHPGSMTSIHANSEVEAFGRLAMMLSSAPEATGMSRNDINALITATIDVVVQVVKDEKKGYRMVGIYYEPERKLALVG